MTKLSRLPIWVKIGPIRNLSALSTLYNYYNSALVISGAETMAREGDNC
ncbi:MAG: hypothetical protein O9324_07650 [Microcystis sp. LE19-84.1B]|nr:MULTISPECIES: hypothetical protein [Microcystis]MCZ8223820.1 hypothetical protein [Microcystis sp. LE19-84.1B]